jgi:hypothetical protein
MIRRGISGAEKADLAALATFGDKITPIQKFPNRTSIILAREASSFEVALHLYLSIECYMLFKFSTAMQFSPV